MSSEYGAKLGYGKDQFKTELKNRDFIVKTKFVYNRRLKTKEENESEE